MIVLGGIAIGWLLREGLQLAHEYAHRRKERILMSSDPWGQE